MARQITKQDLYAVVDIPKGDGVTQTTKVAVPRIYLFKKKDSQDMYVKFMKQPLSREDTNLLADFLSKPTVRAPESWPLFKCKVISMFQSQKEATNYLMSQLLPKQSQAATRKTKAMANQSINITANGNSNKGMYDDDDIEKILNDLPHFDLTKAAASPVSEMSPEVSPSKDIQSRGLDAGVDAGLDAGVDAGLDAGIGEGLDAQIGGGFDADVGAGLNLDAIVGDGLDADGISPGLDTGVNVTLKAVQESCSVPGETLTQTETLDITLLLVNKTELQEMLNAVKRYFDEKITSLTDHFNTKFTGLESKVSTVSAKFSNIQQSLDELKTWTMVNRPFGDNDNIMPLAKFAEKHSVSLPLAQLQDFDDFNAKLSLESTLYKDLKNHIICTVNSASDDFVEEITKLLKKILSREVVIAHTAQRQSNHKTRIFKGTNFYICLKDSLMHICTGKKIIQDGMLCQAIGTIINNAPDWDGFRNKRMRAR